jgi:cytochrome c
MKNASVVWRDDTLARFIADPQRVVPGSTMTYAMSTDRTNTKELIDFLRSATR